MKILSMIFFIVGGILLIHGITAIVESGERSYCGVIKYKIDATRYGKHSAHADPIFVMNFSSQGDEEAFIKEIHPDWNTYLSHNEGDRVCFTLTHPNRPNEAEGPLLTVIAVLILFASLCLWLGDGD